MNNPSFLNLRERAFRQPGWNELPLHMQQSLHSDIEGGRVKSFSEVCRAVEELTDLQNTYDDMHEASRKPINTFVPRITGKAPDTLEQAVDELVSTTVSAIRAQIRCGHARMDVIAAFRAKSLHGVKFWERVERILGC